MGGNMKVIIILLTILLTSCSIKGIDKAVLDESEKITEVDEIEISEKNERVKTEAKTEAVAEGPRSPLSGELLTNPSKRVYGVMIDNHPEARPQYGLSQAEIVYNIETEANIPRFFALFYSGDIKLIGPIRSLRPYFIDYALENKAMIIRYGGSDQADYEASDLGLAEINGMVSSYIWREENLGKFAPHNAFTSTQTVRQAIEDNGWEKEAGENFKFHKQAKDITGPSGKTLDLIYASENNVTYGYNQVTKTYDRFIDGVKMVDAGNNKPVSPKNIILQLTDFWFMDDGVHRGVNVVGSGKGFYFTHGCYQEITWSKADRFSPTKYFDQKGEELVLNPGQIFIEVFDINKEFIIK